MNKHSFLILQNIIKLCILFKKSYVIIIGVNCIKNIYFLYNYYFSVVKYLVNLIFKFLDHFIGFLIIYHQ